jgi:transcription-repair coupling factor (superfamily II helicase)
MDRWCEKERFLPLEHALHQGESLLIEELWNSPKALIASFAQATTGKNLLILTGGSQEEGRLFHDFPFFTERAVINFPAWETLPEENIPPSPDIVGDRYQVMNALANRQEPVIILSSLHACLQRLIPPEQFKQLFIKLARGQTIPFDSLIRKLIELGYTRTPVASDKGEFAVRGGIIDLFAVSSPDPVRIEFFGDNIESLRIYDPVGQRSIKTVEEIDITPAQEKELVEKSKNSSTLLEYLGPGTLVIIDDILALEDRYVSLLKTTSPSFTPIDQFLEKAAALQTLYWSSQPIEELSAIERQNQKGYYSKKAPLQELTFEVFNKKLHALRWVHPFVPLSDYLLPDQEEVTGDDLLQSLEKYPDLQISFLSPTELEETQLQKRLLNLPQKPHFQLGYLSSGFALPEEGKILFPTTEITHRYKIRRQKQRSTYHTPPSQPFELAPGELVVHFNHGIGKYLGIEKRPNHEGVPTEFFLVEYAENGKLYVPVNQAHLITKYIGAHDETPKLHTIGSHRWNKAKEQTERAILGYAKELLQIYAEREIKGGFAFPEDTADICSFEEEFPFVETEDQLQAVKQIKQDMISSKPMDRLICGDVGYGKTEVAMRAAFKAVVEGGKQVAVLVPTTVLAMQHYDSFKERFANFPVNVAVLSRFRTPKETKQTLENLAKGAVDIIIGTHRLISGDIHFKDLGLIIIDEEQRFGVRAKEHLKKIRTSVDCLTLSATPIPRTLYMSLIGARDMSIISTPPQDRLPITTIIADASEKVIKTALLRELARDGQAFVIHNRVETIHEFAAQIRAMLPAARIAICHGQMDADESDSVFHAFRTGSIDILVATTIVESGLDIPNANTILIDRADRFGLGELYQLRGRVGRWNRKAYAYFLVPKTTRLSEISQKRLHALTEASGYGGGMKIAMRDLEIRGGGDILGLEQSGHVSTIGFHLYCKLLTRTVRALQGKGPSVLHDIKMEFSAIDARLPEDYVNETSLRMEIYQRFGEALNLNEADDIWSELQDRFGPPPMAAIWLFRLTRIRIFAQLHGLTLIRQQKATLTLEMGKGKTALVRNLLWKAPSTPEAFEEALIKTIKQTFSISV